MEKAVTVYGTTWCGDCRVTTRHLNQLGIPYEFVNIDENEEGEKKVIQWNDGRRRVPTVVLASGGETRTLSVPSRMILERELLDLGIGTNDE